MSQSNETHRCEGRLRGFGGGQCDHRATIEYQGKWYCGKHDPTPKTLAGEPKYVWVLWQLQGSCFHVTKHVLIKEHPSGSITIRVRGHDKLVKRATGQHFFTDEAAMLAHVRAVMESRLKSIRTTADDLAANLAKPDCGIVLEVVPHEQKKPKGDAIS